jgi:cytosine/adenosine deaminase-related metal-dependent hydrolase
MSTFLLEHIDTLATFDDKRQVLQNAWVLIRDQWIEAVGTGTYDGAPVDQRMNMSGYVILPGLVNLHHHFFQALLKNIPALQDVSLFGWLETIQMLMSEVHDEELFVATKINVAELLLSGCTTAVDHNYLRARADLHHDTQIKAAHEMGIRYHHARGSNSQGFDDIVEKEDDALADTERLIKTFHDPNPAGMIRIENAPGAPFSMSTRYFKESIAMARKHGVGNHTHLAQSPEDDRLTREKFGKKSVIWAEEAGWVGPDVWYAHATILDSEEKAIIKRTGTGICHCPNSNMYTAAGCCEVTAMLKEGGFKIGLGVDGSAANNSSNLFREVRSALLLQRAFYGADALSPTQALELGVLGGAMVLRRNDIGVIAPGMAADIIGVDFRKLPFAGGIHDPIAGLVLCDVDQVDLTIVNGEVRVLNGELVGEDIPTLISQANQLGQSLVRRTEKRFNISISTPSWRRAYPYDAL